MLNSVLPPRLKIAAASVLLAISACTPQYDWREIRGTNVPFTVTLPSKPSVHSRPVNLDGKQVTMEMTAAEANGVIFAVGTAELDDPAAAQKAISAMKTAMIKNINGRVTLEKSAASAKSSAVASSQLTAIDIEAIGPPTPASNGQSQLLFGRFVAKERKVYQAIVIGKEKAVSREAVETFLSSFKPD